jgi:hypothetical protein
LLANFKRQLAADQLERPLAEQFAAPSLERGTSAFFAIDGDGFEIIRIGDDLGGDVFLLHRQLQQHPQQLDRGLRTFRRLFLDVAGAASSSFGVSSASLTISTSVAP